MSIPILKQVSPNSMTMLPLRLVVVITALVATMASDSLPLCPDEAPEDMSACLAVDQRCRYMPIVCELTQEIFFSQTCFCFADNTYSCAISEIVCPATEEPSACPVDAPSTGDTCDEGMTSCNYNPFGLPGSDDAGIFLTTCSCDSGAFTCLTRTRPSPAEQAPAAAETPAPVTTAPTDVPATNVPATDEPTTAPVDAVSELIEECPEIAPRGVEDCAYPGELSCDYGEFCCDGDCVPFRQCSCNDDGKFVCEFPFSACRDFCPEEEPEVGGQCSTSELIECDYGEFCCGSFCKPDKTCFCNDEEYECAETIVSCPKMCPDTKPAPGDSCDLIARIDCPYNFGECPNDLELPRSVCFCEDGTYTCIDLCSDVASLAPITRAPVSRAPTAAAPVPPPPDIPVTNAPMEKTPAPVAETDAPSGVETEAPIATETEYTEPTNVPTVIVGKPPRPCPSVPADGCSVCGEGLCVTNFDAVFEFPPFPESPCGVLQAAGFQAAVPLDSCPFLPGLVTACECKSSLPGTGSFTPAPSPAPFVSTVPNGERSEINAARSSAPTAASFVATSSILSAVLFILVQ